MNKDDEFLYTKLHVYNKADVVHKKEHAKQVLKTRFYSITFGDITCYSGTNKQGSQEFIPNI